MFSDIFGNEILIKTNTSEFFYEKQKKKIEEKEWKNPEISREKIEENKKFRENKTKK